MSRGFRVPIPPVFAWAVPCYNPFVSNGPEFTRRIADLLRDPRETLEVELKGWLDIVGDGEHKATLAKELIALANHGGGYVILGFSETEDGVVPSKPRPANLAGYTPDTVNSAVSRYADPAFHCDVHIVASPETELEYPIIAVPGGHQVPIRSRRGSPEGRGIQADRYYIRRPGPNSEQPQTGQEWTTLIGRCVANAREELVDRFRNIMAGGVESTVAKTDFDRLSRWFDSSVDRWRMLAEELADDHGARLLHGHYAIGYNIIGDFDTPQGVQLLEALRDGCPRHSGWPPFWVPTREGIAPYIYSGNVEYWLGPDGDNRDPAHSDYWRVSPAAEFFLMRGYQEDGMRADRGIEPGTQFDLTLPTWRIAEVLLHAESMARQFGAEHARIILAVRWTGLRGRQLATIANPNRILMPERHISHQDTFDANIEVTANQIREMLPEQVDRMVRPLYELFDFFQLPATLVGEELTRMRERRL